MKASIIVVVVAVALGWGVVGARSGMRRSVGSGSPVNVAQTPIQKQNRALSTTTEASTSAVALPIRLKAEKSWANLFASASPFSAHPSGTIELFPPKSPSANAGTESASVPGKDSRLAPRVYKTEPYACIVVVPGPLDEGMSISPSADNFSMPMSKPALRFVPFKTSGK